MVGQLLLILLSLGKKEDRSNIKKEKSHYPLSQVLKTCQIVGSDEFFVYDLTSNEYR